MYKQQLEALSWLEQKEVQLIGLLRSAGYKKCRLGKFDEYELFDRNRAFLEGDRMLTFTDPYGKLYALRPDVTLSVMKQAVYQPENEYHVYYKEDVFRLSPETHQYEAHCQIGAECIEKNAVTSRARVLELAAQALGCLDGRSVLVVSHMGFLLKNEWYLAQGQTERDQILRYIGQKNKHDLLRYLDALQCPEEHRKKLTGAVSLTGMPQAVLRKIQKEGLGKELLEAAEETEQYVRALPAVDRQQVVLDFSLVNPLSYYNGLVFQGFLEGCSRYVLSGGQYDRLAMRFMPQHQNSCRAIGFALNMDVLEPIGKGGLQC